MFSVCISFSLTKKIKLVVKSKSEGMATVKKWKLWVGQLSKS